MSTIVALIPARSGSKGVPHKNIRELGGHPLIEWSIVACKKSHLVDRVIVSTDSKEYAELSISKGAEAPFLRPIEISSDKSTDYEFIEHALNWLAQNGGEPQYIVHIRPTTPIRNPILIDQAIKHFISSPIATAMRSVHLMAESAYKTFEIAPSSGQLRQVGSKSTALDVANNARQVFPQTYIANGYVDILSTKFIRENQMIHGDHVIPFITPVTHEVDSEEDFDFLEFQLSKYPQFLSQLFN